MPIGNGWHPVLNKHGIAYMFNGNMVAVTIDDWITNEYFEQAKELCSALGLSSIGSTPSSTASRILERFLDSPIGQSFSFSKSLRESGCIAGGRAEVGCYGMHESPISDIDFRAAYGTILSIGPGDLARTNLPVNESDFVDATVSDDSKYPITRVNVLGRDFYAKTNSVRRVLTLEELKQCNVLKIHSTFTLERRKDIASLATTLLKLRDEWPVCKLILNSLVGRLAVDTIQRPIAVEYPKSGDTYIAPGIWSRDIASKPKGAAHIYAFITGTCRGYITSLLRKTDPLTWDTDGTVIRNSINFSSWGPFELKQRSVDKIEIWASKISLITVGPDVEIRAGGLPGSPKIENMRRLLKYPGIEEIPYKQKNGIMFRKSDGTPLGRPVNKDGSTRPYDMRELI